MNPSSQHFKWFPALRFLVVVSSLGMTPAAAYAQSSSSDTVSRIAALEQQIASLQRDLRALAAPAVAGAGENRDPERSLTVEERFDELDQQIRILARQIEIEKEAADARAKTVPAIGAGREGFVLKSADNNFQLKVRGYLQADGRFFPDDAGSRGVDTFVMRRVRPIFEATMYKLYDFRVMPDFGAGTTVLQDAYLDARFRSDFKVRAGKFKAPFGIERLASATELLFVERALPTSLVPNRDVGVMVHGDVAAGRVNYGIGVFNGVADGGSTDADESDGKDVTGRVFLLPLRNSKNAALQGVGVGLAASMGSRSGTVASPNLAAFRGASQLTFFRFRSDATAAGTTIADGDHDRVSAQGHYYVGRFGLLGEHVTSRHKVRRAADVATLQHASWQLAANYVLTGEKATPRGVAPTNDFDRSKGKWGAFELTARVNALAIDRDAFPLFADTRAAAREATAWGVGTNWYLNRGVKFTIDFERTAFEGGAATGDRPSENTVFTRMQFSF